MDDIQLATTCGITTPMVGGSNHIGGEQLLSLPLFYGMGREEAEELAASGVVFFGKVKAGFHIAEEAQECVSLTFVLSGVTNVETRLGCGGLLTETIQSPLMVQPERFFGLSQRYSRTFTACTDCSIMKLGKDAMLGLFSKHPVCRVNMSNMLCTIAQRREDLLVGLPGGSVGRRFSQMLSAESLAPSGHKHLDVKMVQMAEALGTSRLNVSLALNGFARLGLLRLGRGKIDVYDLQELSQHAGE